MSSTSSLNKIKNLLETLWYGEIERTWLKKPQPHKRSVSLFIMPSNINTGSNGSRIGFETEKLWIF